MAILRSFFILLLFQLAGEILTQAAHIAIPGPVLGMAMLAAFYVLRKREPDEPMQRFADGLLSWLGMLFVPAGVGVVANVALLRAAWLPVSAALVVSTLLALITIAAIMHSFRGRKA